MSYVVEISPFEEDKFTCAGEVNADVLSYEISDLTEDCKYDVQVKAVNEIGPGVPSIAVTCIHTRDYTGNVMHHLYLNDFVWELQHHYFYSQKFQRPIFLLINSLLLKLVPLSKYLCQLEEIQNQK